MHARLHKVPERLRRLCGKLTTLQLVAVHAEEGDTQVKIMRKAGCM